MRRTLFVGQALDAATFALFFLVIPQRVIDGLGVTEQNPLLAALMTIGGFAAVVAVKVGAVSAVIYRDTQLPHRMRKTTAFMAAAALSGYIGATFNIIALATVLAVMSVA